MILEHSSLHVSFLRSHNAISGKVTDHGCV